MSLAAYSRASFERVIAQLESQGCAPRVRDDHIDASCPLPGHSHGDKNPSLSVDWKDGRVLVLCHRCTTDATPLVLQALGLTFSDLYDEPKSNPNRRPKPRATLPKKAVVPAEPKKRANPLAGMTIVDRYDYFDYSNTPIMRVLRYQDPTGERSKTFRFQRWAGTRWVASHNDGVPRDKRVLFRLPEIRTAIEAGQTIFVTEGEKDAKALVDVGVEATTNPLGAAAKTDLNEPDDKWLPQYCEQLAGAQLVVVVIDRDYLDKPQDPGAIHAARVRHGLRSANIPYTLVEAAEGKDAYDHLKTHNLAVEAFRSVSDDDLDSRLAAAVQAKQNALTNLQNDVHEETLHFDNITALPVRQHDINHTSLSLGEPIFQQRHDRIVRVTLKREQGEFVESVKTILGCVARIVRTEQSDIDGSMRTTAYVLAISRTTGDDETEVRVSRADFISGDWLADLPWSDVYYDGTRNGLASVCTAIKMTSTDSPVAQVHEQLGWKEINGRDVYIHARGGITSDGSFATHTEFADELAHFWLPQPSSDPKEIRAAAQHSIALMSKLPSRIGSVLCGFAYRSVLGWTPSSVMLRGLQGSGKTSLAAVTTQHLAPDLSHEECTFSLTRNGHTPNAPAEFLYRAKDSIVFADDAAPDRSVREASVLLTELIRSQFNHTSKKRLTREITMRKAHRPNGSLLLASEVRPSTASGAERVFDVPLTPGDVPVETLKSLHRPESRHGRAALMAAYIQWLAGRLTAVRETMAIKHHEFMTCILDTHSFDTRAADAMATLAVGWYGMCEFLTDVGAFSAEESEELWAIAWAGLTEATDQQVDPDTVTHPAPRFLQLLRSAFRSGLLYLTDERGNIPDDAQRAGWKPDARTTYLTSGDTPMLVPSGQTAGVLGVDRETGELRAWLDPHAALTAVRKVGANVGTPYEVDEPIVREALDNDGFLKCSIEAGKRRRTVRRPLPGGRDRVYDIGWHAIWEDDDNPTASGPPPLRPHHEPTTAEPNEPAPQTNTETATVATLFAAFPGATVVNDETSASHATNIVQTTPVTPSDIAPDITKSGAPPLDDSKTPAAAPTTFFRPRNTTSPVQSAPTPAPKPREPDQRRTAHSEPRWLAPAAVIDNERIWLPGGEVRDLPATFDHLGHVAALVTTLKLGHGGGKTRPDMGQVWLTGPALLRLGLPDAVTADFFDRPAFFDKLNDCNAVIATRSDGWNIGNRSEHSPDGRLDTWTRMWRGTGTATESAMIVALPWHTAAATDIPILRNSDHPGDLAERLNTFADIVGMSYRLSSAATGRDLIDFTRPIGKGSTPDITTSVFPEPAHSRNLERDYHWHRQLDSLTPDERNNVWVHGYDRGGSYLPVCSSLALGNGEATYFGSGSDFEALRKLPGYWRVANWQWTEWGVPNPAIATGSPLDDRSRWITTPTLAVLERHGIAPRVIEAWLWTEHSRYLRPWYERLRDARSELYARLEAVDDTNTSAVLRTVKDCYTHGVGKLTQGSREGERLWRPDWRHQIIAASRGALDYRITANGELSGRWPVALVTDAVFYASDNPNPIAAWPGASNDLGTGLGKFKVIGSAMLNDWHDDKGEHFLARSKFPLGQASDALTPFKGNHG